MGGLAAELLAAPFSMNRAHATSSHAADTLGPSSKGNAWIDRLPLFNAAIAFGPKMTGFKLSLL